MHQHIIKKLTIAFLLILTFEVGLYIYFNLKQSSPIQTPEITQTSQPQPVIENGPFYKTLTVLKGDTLASLLTNLKIPSSQVHEAVKALSQVYNPQDLKTDQEIPLVYSRAPNNPEEFILESLTLRPDISYSIELRRNTEGGFHASKQQIQLTHQHQVIQGNIGVSLYTDGLKAGAFPSMLYDMIKAFSYDVDFQRDIQQDDTFTLVYDSYKDPKSSLERPGELLYAKLILGGIPYEIYRFKPPGGISEFYTPKGDAVKKSLLRTPIDGARLTSGFGRRRDPILGYSKMHQGLDFAAPIGTPIMAAGDGIVERASRYSGYGNYVVIRHRGGIKTAYGHLKGYAKGIKAQKSVKQGQTIGYVGMTGRTTGPHLHFELIKGGKKVNPKEITKLPTLKLAGKSLKIFNNEKEKIDKIISQNKRNTEQKSLAQQP